MKSKELLEIIACENGLEYIETTTGMNGYPQCIRGAIIGFQSFEEAEKLAKEHNLCIRTFFKRAGWQLYERNINTTWEPLEIGCSDYGDNYNQYTVDDLENFFEEQVSPMLGDFDNFEDLQTFINNSKEVYEKLQSIDETQIVIAYLDRYYETIDRKLMSWSNDGKTWVIGIMAEEI